jgi:rRNA processing protein Gar1
LRRLGRIIHISKNRRFILRLELDNEIPHIGEKIFDSNLKVVGTINDIFGSVQSPYAAVSIRDRDPLDYINKPVYLKKKLKS